MPYGCNVTKIMSSFSFTKKLLIYSPVWQWRLWSSTAQWTLDGDLFSRFAIALAIIHCTMTFGWVFGSALGYLLDCIYTSVVGGTKYPRRFGSRYCWLRTVLWIVMGEQGLFMVSAIYLMGPGFLFYHIQKLLFQGEFAWKTISFWSARRDFK